MNCASRIALTHIALALALAASGTSSAQEVKPKPTKPIAPLANRLAPVAVQPQQPQPWGGNLLQAPMTPAPEVIRLWDAQTVAAVRLSSHDLSAVAELDSREFVRREAASTKLRANSVTADVIFAILLKAQLSVEQRERLLTIAQEKVLALPRGALGLRMQPSGDVRNPGVEVLLLLPGMPAERVLKIGDRIERIDGQPLATSSDLVEIIQSKLPGESVRLSVARQQRDDRGKPKIDPAGGFVEDRMEFEVALTTAIDLDKFEDRLSSPVRSVVLERRLLALREAEERFAPATSRVIAPLPAPIQVKKPRPPKDAPIEPQPLDD